MEPITTNLSEEDLKEIDKLVEKRLFSDRDQVIKTGVRVLLEMPEEELKRMEEARAEVNAFLTDCVGDILSGGTPIHTVANFKEYYKIPVTGFFEGRFYTYGHIFVDFKTLRIDEKLSDSPKKIHKTALELTGGSEDESPLLSTGTLV